MLTFCQNRHPVQELLYFNIYENGRLENQYSLVHKSFPFFEVVDDHHNSVTDTRRQSLIGHDIWLACIQ